VCLIRNRFFWRLGSHVFLTDDFPWDFMTRAGRDQVTAWLRHDSNGGSWIVIVLNGIYGLNWPQCCNLNSLVTLSHCMLTFYIYFRLKSRLKSRLELVWIVCNLASCNFSLPFQYSPSVILSLTEITLKLGFFYEKWASIKIIVLITFL
jgi:hypothetical protein